MFKAATQHYMSSHNQRLVLDYVRTRGPISRADIVRLSGLTFPSVSRIVGELISRGFVEEKRQRRGGMGKPPTELELNPGSAFAIGLGLDRDHLGACLVNLTGDVVAERQQALETTDPAQVTPLMVELVQGLLDETATPKSKLLGVGVALPEDLGPWQDTPLSETLGEQLGCSVRLESSATAAAIGERWYGAGRTIKNFIQIFFASELGGAMIINAQPYRGHNGLSGKLSHIPLRDADGALRAAGAQMSLGRLFEQLGSEGKSKAVLEAHYEVEDKTVHAWVDQSADGLAPLIVYSECLLDPEAIIFGGRLPPKMMRGLIERVAERLAAHRVLATETLPQLLQGRVGDNAAAFGAAAVPIFYALTPDLTASGDYRRATAQEG